MICVDWTPDLLADTATLFVNDEAGVESVGVPDGLKVRNCS